MAMPVWTPDAKAYLGAGDFPVAPGAGLDALCGAGSILEGNLP